MDCGRTRAIGVSNFNAEQLVRLTSAARIKPANLQVELHAYLQQKELRKCCAELGITVTAYSPLGSPGAKEHFVNKYNYRCDKLINKRIKKINPLLQTRIRWVENLSQLANLETDKFSCGYCKIDLTLI